MAPVMLHRGFFFLIEYIKGAEDKFSVVSKNLRQRGLLADPP
jgi:hypothetical protein